MADNEKLNQFISVTGVDGDRARFYLESAAWQLEVALASFYENDGGLEDPSVVDLERSPELVRHEPPSHSSDIAASSSISSPKQKNVKPKANSKFATIHTLNGSSSDEEEEEGQAFYAGGSEHSGQQVLGPKKDDIIKNMFKAVREQGVELLEPSTSAPSVFKGTGYKLGQTPSDSEMIAGAPEAPSTETRTLRLWKNGFTIDNSELRDYSNPANKEFLNQVLRGELPLELRKTTTKEIHLAVEDHHGESYKQQSVQARAFSGHGYTLGSPTPAVVGAPAIQEQDCKANEARAKASLKVDTSQPTTNIQIRLADGSRLVAQFNQDHTLAEVRAYILSARPQYETRPFSLLTTYPSRELKDSETLKEAGLLNAAIMQKLV